MKEPGLNFVIGLIILCLVILSYSIVDAQSLTKENPRSGSNLSIEYLYPNFKSGSDISAWVIHVKSEIKINENNYFVCDFPMTGGEVTYEYWDYSHSESETAIGNPYVGFKFRKYESPVTVDLGIRIPVGSDEKWMANQLGWITDIENLDGFMSDHITFKSMVNFRADITDNFIGEIGLGPKLFVYAGGDCSCKPEAILDYSLKGSYLLEKFDFGVGLTGLVCLTEDEFLGEDPTINFLQFESGYNADNVRPGVEIGFPVDDDFDDILDMVIGVNFKFYF